MGTKRSAHPTLAGEGGYSLPELLVAAAIGLIVIGAGMVLLSTVVRSQPQTGERAGQVQQGRTMIERITRELRQAESVATATASNLEMVTYVDSASCGGPSAPAAIVCRVSYDCVGATCSRTERNPDGSGSAAPVQIVAGIRTPSVFGYQPATNPSHVSVTLEFADDDGEETITLSDGAAPRNWFDPGGGPEL